MEGGAGSFGGLKDSNFEVIWPEIRSTGNTVVAIDYSSATRPNFGTARSVKELCWSQTPLARVTVGTVMQCKVLGTTVPHCCTSMYYSHSGSLTKPGGLPR